MVDKYNIIYIYLYIYLFGTGDKSLPIQRNKNTGKVIHQYTGKNRQVNNFN